MTTRSSRRTGSAWGELRWKRKRAPCTTPGGSFSRTRRCTSESPVPQQAPQGSVQVSPRPPQKAQVPRKGISSGSTTPRDASRSDSEISVAGSAVLGCSPRNASHARAVSAPTDGKSIAISSAKQSCDVPAPPGASHNTGSGSSRKRSRLTMNLANDRSGFRPCQWNARVLT